MITSTCLFFDLILVKLLGEILPLSLTLPSLCDGVLHKSFGFITLPSLPTTDENHLLGILRQRTS